MRFAYIEIVGAHVDTLLETGWSVIYHLFMLKHLITLLIVAHSIDIDFLKRGNTVDNTQFNSNEPLMELNLNNLQYKD